MHGHHEVSWYKLGFVSSKRVAIDNYIFLRKFYASVIAVLAHSIVVA